MKTLSLRDAVRPLLFAIPAVAAAVTTADAGITGIWRTNNDNGVASALTNYTSLANLAAGTASGGTATLSNHGAGNGGIDNARFSYVFGDFTQAQTTQGYLYRTVYGSNGRISQIIRYEALASDPLANFRTNTGGQTFNFALPTGSGGWDREDDFFADGLGNFYRNRTAGGGSNGVTKYTSFANLVDNVGGVTSNYSVTYGFNDRFFGFEGKFYRTNTGGPNNSVSGFAVYNSFADLLSGTVAQTISSANWSAGDMFIPVPAPGAMALAALAGLAGRRNRRR